MPHHRSMTMLYINLSSLFNSPVYLMCSVFVAAASCAADNKFQEIAVDFLALARSPLYSNNCHDHPMQHENKAHL